MPKPRRLLAVDQGSSGTKAAVFDDSGRLLRMAARRTPVSHPDVVAAEADPEGWWRALAECVREAAQGHHVDAVALCGFMHTLVPVAEDGTVTGPALLWPDQRPASAPADGLAASALDGLAASVPAPAGRTAVAAPAYGSCVERIRWWAARSPEAVARTRWFLPVKDFLRLRLTGTAATDRYEAAGTGFADPATGTWSPRVAAYAGIEPDRLPPIREPLDIAGEVTPRAAALTGLTPGTPVAAGTGDWMATLLGSGAVLPGRACLYLGTAGAVGGFASPDAAARLTEPLCFAAATSTGSALDWAAGLLGGLGGAAGALAEAAGDAPPGARGVVFLPHLMGERGDAPRPSARGSVFGLTLAHTRADLARAVLEGTAMWLRAIAGAELARRAPAELVAAGGGARSEVWLRVLAAVLERDLLVPETTEAGLLGGALIAATATGSEGRDTLAARRDRWVRTARTVPAAPDLVKTYRPLYDEFLRVEALAAEADAARREPHQSPRPTPDVDVTGGPAPG
ncbi:xylulokinase [Sphaerisporangium aureirubrum]|uniref:FGGY-family carbohydrate kinase n=1 Tax=Sphaerisporangium aureirubrum TaxID=1544736 RepID=A0ABW1NF92_9ACTN